jgi:transcriptional regulator with XRE-family HTH domain
LSILFSFFLQLFLYFSLQIAKKGYNHIKEGDDMTTFDKRLQELRASLELTQDDFLEKFNHKYGYSFKRAAISLYETGKRGPKFSVLKDMCDFFGVSLDYMMGRSDIKNPLIHQALKEDKELTIFWESMQDREDLQIMFKKTKELTPDAVRKIIEIIKLIEDGENK